MINLTPDAIPLLGLGITMLLALLVRLFFRHSQPIRRLEHAMPARAKARPRALHIPANALKATYSTNLAVVLPLTTIALLWLGWEAYTLYTHYYVPFKAFYVASGLMFVAQILLAMFDRPRKATAPDNYYVVMVVPVYNEDEASLQSSFKSLFYQTRMPNEIHVTDDGSNVDYTNASDYLLRQGAKLGIKVTWNRYPNAGKREAQVAALKHATKDIANTILVTIDSDVVLDPHALEEGLKPFGKSKVQSVAGLVLAKNAQANVLSRFTDLLFVGIQQLVDRASMSRVSNVLVNSGGLALYRLEVVLDAIGHGYLKEQFFGRKISMSDDSYLTLVALKRGCTVQQASAIVFTDMPITFNHHRRQQMRWMRGSFIRSWWRIRHLPILSFGFLRQLLGWCLFVSNLVILTELLVVLPYTKHAAVPWFIIFVPILVGYVQSTRYFCVKRSDMTRPQQALIYLMAPMAALWTALLLRPMRLYAMLTCRKAGWGTRVKVENAGESKLQELVVPLDA